MKNGINQVCRGGHESLKSPVCHLRQSPLVRHLYVSPCDSKGPALLNQSKKFLVTPCLFPHPVNNLMFGLKKISFSLLTP